MRSQALNKKLNSVKNQIPVTAKPEEEEAYDVLGHLATLAHGYRDYDPA